LFLGSPERTTATGFFHEDKEKQADALRIGLSYDD
jgi:hypothetical protein